MFSDVFQQRQVRDILSNESAALEKRGQLKMHEKAPADPHSADPWRVERHEFLSHKLSGMQPHSKLLRMHDRLTGHRSPVWTFQPPYTKLRYGGKKNSVCSTKKKNGNFLHESFAHITQMTRDGYFSRFAIERKVFHLSVKVACWVLNTTEKAKQMS